MEDLERMAQRGVSGALQFFDLDQLKTINDRYGHATGGEALRLTGRILSRFQRQSDVAGRLGGDEFGLFQTGLAFEEVHTRCKEVREEIAAIVLYAISGSRVQISASIGACHCPTGFNPSDSLKAADENLYQARKLCRNRVVA